MDRRIAAILAYAALAFSMNGAPAEERPDFLSVSNRQAVNRIPSVTDVPELTEEQEALEESYGRWHGTVAAVEGRRAIICVEQPDNVAAERRGLCVQRGWWFFNIPDGSPRWKAGVYEVESSRGRLKIKAPAKQKQVTEPIITEARLACSDPLCGCNPCVCDPCQCSTALKAPAVVLGTSEWRTYSGAPPVYRFPAQPAFISGSPCANGQCPTR